MKLPAAGSQETPAPPRVVTVGGGHGQASILTALAGLGCTITAVATIADDGGCSGRLREELGMPPPGDLRRCLGSLARDRALAVRFEARLAPRAELPSRSVGNLILSEAFRRLGSLEAAVDWAAEQLRCVGRVVPAAERAGTLAVYDRARGHLEGETRVEEQSEAPMVATVIGPERATPSAVVAIEEADIVLLGPGSFIGSTLAAVTTGDLADAIARTRARRVFVENVAPERGDRPLVDDPERVLCDHLTFRSDGERVVVDVLRHAELETPGIEERADGTRRIAARLSLPGERVHAASLVHDAFAVVFGLALRAEAEVEPAPGAAEAFEEHLAAALRRIVA